MGRGKIVLVANLSCHESSQVWIELPVWLNCSLPNRERRRAVALRAIVTTALSSTKCC